MKHKLKIIISLSLASCLLVLVLFATEYYFKLLYFRNEVTLLNSDYFIRIKTLAPNYQMTFTPTEKDVLDSFQLEIKDYPCITDSFGFIITSKNHQAPDIKLAFFGGSTIRCLWNDEDKRIPEAVARIVEHRTGQKINSWNCAAGGTNSYHTLNVLNNLALNLNLDYAFFYGNINDMGALLHYGTFNNKNPDKGIFFNLNEYNIRNLPPEGSLFPFLTDAFKARFHLKEKPDEFADVRGNPLRLDSALIFSQVRRVYKTIVSSCKANNIQPVIITDIKQFDKLNYGWMRKNMPQFKLTPEEYVKVKLLFHQYNSVLRNIAEEENIMLIDLEKRPMDLDDFYDAVHFNNKGSMVASEIIASEFIEKQKKEPKKYKR